jgi:hypothetical protein
MSSSTAPTTPAEHGRRARRSWSLGALVLGLFVVQAAIVGVALLVADLTV